MLVEADPNLEGNRRQQFIQRSLEALLESLSPGAKKPFT